MSIAGTRYGPVQWPPARSSTFAPTEAYAPLSPMMRACTAVMRPSASQPILYLSSIGCRFGMDLKAFGPRERDLHRPADEPGHERRLGLDRHVLLAAERTAVAHELGLHAVAIDAQHARTLPLIVEDALALRVDEHPALAVRRRFQRIAGRRMAVVFPRLAQLVERQRRVIDRNRDARLGLQEEMLDPLRAVRVFNDVGRLGGSLLRRRRA